MENEMRMLDQLVIPGGRNEPLDMGGILRCPACGSEWVRPYGVAIRPPGFENSGRLYIDAKGIHWDKTMAPVGRGVSLNLNFCCESGHVFQVHIRFHKGITYCRVLLGEHDMVETEDGLFPSVDPVIWRD